MTATLQLTDQVLLALGGCGLLFMLLAYMIGYRVGFKAGEDATRRDMGYLAKSVASVQQKENR